MLAAGAFAGPKSELSPVRSMIREFMGIVFELRIYSMQAAVLKVAGINM
jgi:hypothetical protein